MSDTSNRGLFTPVPHPESGLTVHAMTSGQTDSRCKGQIRWSVDSLSPVIRPGQLHPGFDDLRAGAGHVLRLGDRYRLYYWGGGPRGNVILMAESPVEHPNAWAPRGGLLLEAQRDTDYNVGGPSFPFVFPITRDRWVMIFGAWGRQRADGTLPNTTGLALSDDAGISWRYPAGEPLLTLDRPYDRSATGSVSVVRAGGEFRMYYTAIGHWFDRPAGVRTGHGDRIPRIGIALATSRDGLHWTKPMDRLLVEPRGFDADPYEYINSKPFVLEDDGGWRMFISTFGHAYRIRSLFSRDGLAWERVPSGPDGDLGVGPAGAFDDAMRCYASVVRHGAEYRMWYTGNSFGTTGMGYATGRLAV